MVVHKALTRTEDTSEAWKRDRELISETLLTVQSNKAKQNDDPLSMRACTSGGIPRGIYTSVNVRYRF